MTVVNGRSLPDVVLAGSDGESIAGTIDATPVTDPEAATATMMGLLRGILAELKAQTALLNDIANP